MGTVLPKGEAAPVRVARTLACAKARLPGLADLGGNL